jgi:tight adherence protein C
MLIPLYVFLGVSLLFFGAAMLLVRTGNSGEGEVFAAGRKRAMIFGPLTPALAALLPVGAKTRKRLSLELCQAGYYHRDAAAEYLALRNTLVIGWILLVGALFVVGSEPGAPPDLRLLAAGVIGMLLLYGVPRMALGMRAKARVQRIEYSLPDALDMISMCMSGGLTFPQSLSRVGTELATSYPDLACELRIVSRQSDSGTLSRAIQGFAYRVDTPEVQSLASVIGQTERHGGAVAAAFHQYAMDVRRQRRQLAEEKGNRTSIHMLFPLVLCLAPPVYLLLLAPAAIELRGFVMDQNRPGGLLSPAASLEDATATPMLQQPVSTP